MGYCPRCGENTNLNSGPNLVTEKRQALRLPATSAIVRLSISDNTESVRYGGVRFKVERDGTDWLLWAIE